MHRTFNEDERDATAAAAWACVILVASIFVLGVALGKWVI